MQPKKEKLCLQSAHTSDCFSTSWSFCILHFKAPKGHEGDIFSKVSWCCLWWKQTITSDLLEQDYSRGMPLASANRGCSAQFRFALLLLARNVAAWNSWKQHDHIKLPLAFLFDFAKYTGLLEKKKKKKPPKTREVKLICPESQGNPSRTLLTHKHPHTGASVSLTLSCGGMCRPLKRIFPAGTIPRAGAPALPRGFSPAHIQPLPRESASVLATSIAPVSAQIHYWAPGRLKQSLAEAGRRVAGATQICALPPRQGMPVSCPWEITAIGWAVFPGFISVQENWFVKISACVLFLVLQIWICGHIWERLVLHKG